MASPYPKTVELLRRMGIDPDLISVADFTTAGYYMFVTREGQKQYDEDGIAYRTFHEWPDLATAVRVIDLFIKERDGLI
jgi:hypothetical protein